MIFIVALTNEIVCRMKNYLHTKSVTHSSKAGLNIFGHQCLSLCDIESWPSRIRQAPALPASIRTISSETTPWPVEQEERELAVLTPYGMLFEK